MRFPWFTANRDRHPAEAVPIKPKAGSLLALAATAVVCSRAVFVFIDDPEGPNLVVVIGLAAAIYFPSLAAYLSAAAHRITSLKGFPLAIGVQLAAALGLGLILR